jgi:membrane associated rhomboid family serine protease
MPFALRPTFPCFYSFSSISLTFDIVFRSIVSDIRYQFQSGNTITRLIIVNVAVFLAIMAFKLVLVLMHGLTRDSGIFSVVTSYLFLSDDLIWDAKHPWTIISHMFTHVGFFHMLFNMLILYWFGRIAGDLLGDHRMLPLYLYSGLAGALIYLLSAPLIYEGGSNLHGASAAIMGIVAAAGITAPDYQMRLLLLGDVRLKYIVAGLLAIYIIGIANMENVGGHMAHLGGAAFGFFYVHLLRQGRDLTRGFNRLISMFKKPVKHQPRPSKRKVTMEVRHRAASRKSDIQSPPSDHAYDGDQQRLDSILDKIKATGYQNLSEEDKKFLHDASQK